MTKILEKVRAPMKEHLERVKKIRQGSYGRVAAFVRTGAEIPEGFKRMGMAVCFSTDEAVG